MLHMHYINKTVWCVCAWGSKTIKQLGEIAKENEKMKSQPLKKHVADLKKQLMQIKKDITALEKLFANLEKDL